MAEKKDITVKAKSREGRGKNDARRARRDGNGPSYGLWRRRRNGGGAGAA